MTTAAPSTALATIQPAFTDAERLALAGYRRIPDGEHDRGHLTVADLNRERIHRKPVLGGLINEYSRAA